MAKRFIKTVFQFRRSHTAEWDLNKDIVPAAGEPCYDLDLKTLRIGDGTTKYKDLPVIGNVEAGDTGNLQAEIEAIKAAMETLQTDIDNVETNVSDIQEQVGETDIVEVQASVTQITESVSNLTTQIETTNTEIVTIQETLENKADIEAVETLKTDLQTYVDEQIKNVGSGSIDDGEI